MVELSDGAKTRAQIDSESVKAMLAAAGGGSNALLAFLPYLLEKPKMVKLAGSVLWGLMCFMASLIFCVWHNILRRTCSMRWEAAWIENLPCPPPGKIFGISVKEPTICFCSWWLLYLSVASFAVGTGIVGMGGYETLRAIEAAKELEGLPGER